MNTANTIISALGDVLFAITLVYVVRTLTTARGARTDAQTAELAVNARKEPTDREIGARQQAERADWIADQRGREAAERDRQAADWEIAWRRELLLERRR